MRESRGRLFGAWSGVVFLVSGCTADVPGKGRGGFDPAAVERELTQGLDTVEPWTNITDIRGLITAAAPVTGEFEAERVAGYLFTAEAGAAISLTLTSEDSDPIVLLYGPQQPAGHWPPRLAKNDDALGTDAQIEEFTLALEGTYLALAAEFDGAEGAFELSLDNSSSCEPVTCEDMDAECGTIDDECGGELACGSCPTGSTCSEDYICEEPEAELTALEVRGYVVGEYLYGAGDARESWETACDTWMDKMRALIDAPIDTFGCGDPVDISGGYSFKQYASQPFVRVAYYLPADSALAPFSFSPMNATGTVSDDRNVQWQSWSDDCFDKLAEVKATLGERYLAGVCNEPSDIGGGYAYLQYSGEMTVWAHPAEPVEGQTLELEGYVVGQYLYGRENALANWDQACSAWLTTMREQLPTGVEIERFSCGSASDISGGSSYKQFASRSTATVRTSVDAEDSISAFVPFQAVGVVSSDRSEQWQSWRDDCNAKISRAKDILGDRFLTATCLEPSDISGGYSYLQYAGDVRVWAAPSELLSPYTVSVRGYTVGEYLYGRESALTSWESACSEWVGKMLELNGNGVVESFSCGTYGDISGGSSYKQFASEPILTMQVPGVVGLEPTESVPKHATGVVSDDRNTQWSSWRDDCYAELSELKNDYGARFIAGTCSQPSDIHGGYSYLQYSGEIRLWLLPLVP